MEYTECFKGNKLKGWDKDEKLRLYHAIRISGSYSIEHLQKQFTSKSKEDIEKALRYFKHKALKQEEECKTRTGRSRASSPSHVPLNTWAELLIESYPFNELRTETATALRLIADFENIPEPVCTDKIDFRKVYHTLANALEGKALLDDKYVAAVFDKCIFETGLTSKAFMRCKAFQNAIKQIRIRESDITPFIKPTENDELSIIRYIAMLKNYNPLRIPEERLKFSLLK